MKEAASTIKVDVARRLNDPKAEKSPDNISRVYTFALKDGLVVDGEESFKLMPYDEVYVRKSPAYNEQQNVVVDGEVMFRGTYTLSKKSQRLSELIEQAGGVSDMAYVRGARLIRLINDDDRARIESVLKTYLHSASGSDYIYISKFHI